MPRRNKNTMKSKKRKNTSDDEHSEECNLANELPNVESKTENDDNNKCEKNDCSNSLSEQKSGNGDACERPGTSDIKSEDESKDSDDQISEQSDRKHCKLEGSTVAGTLLFCGGTNWDLIGRSKLPKNAKNAVGENLYGPHRLSSLQAIKVSAVFAGCVAVHSVIITETGQAYTWGRNEKGQLGHSDTERRNIPTLVETLKDHTIVQASCGRGHTLFLSDNGTVFSCGDNKMGQCGVGSQNNNLTIPTKITFKGTSIAKVACGAEFSLICDTRGALYSFGLPEYGALGHNTDGQYFITSSKLAFKCELKPRRIIAFIDKAQDGQVTLIDDVQIVNMACGISHSVALDSKGRCFTWGFGGYGRLGHSLPKDEAVPRLVRTFAGLNISSGVKKVFAGGSFSMAINSYDLLYFWGQSKRTGEACMYPKPVQDLLGWKVRDVACSNTSIMCLAEQSVISWGPGPSYGELGYGEMKKSSAKPYEVSSLKDIHIFSIAMGYGHSLLIARDETKEDKENLQQFPEYTP